MAQSDIDSLGLPRGFMTLLQDISRAVFREKPTKIVDFIYHYLDKKLDERILHELEKDSGFVESTGLELQSESLVTASKTKPSVQQPLSESKALEAEENPEHQEEHETTIQPGQTEQAPVTTLPVTESGIDEKQTVEEESEEMLHGQTTVLATEKPKTSLSNLDGEENEAETVHVSNQESADMHPSLETQEQITAEAVVEKPAVEDKPPEELSQEADYANQKTVPAAEESEPSPSSLETKKGEAEQESNQEAQKSITQIADAEPKTKEPQVTDSDIEEIPTVADKPPEEISQEADDNQKTMLETEEPKPSPPILDDRENAPEHDLNQETHEAVVQLADKESSLEKQEPITAEAEIEEKPAVENKLPEELSQEADDANQKTEEPKHTPSTLDSQKGEAEQESNQEVQQSITQIADAESVENTHESQKSADIEDKPAVEDTPPEELSQEADDVNQEIVTEEPKHPPNKLDDQENALKEPLTAEPEIDENPAVEDKPPEELSQEADDNQKTVPVTEQPEPTPLTLDSQKSEAEQELNQEVQKSIAQIADAEPIEKSQEPQLSESDVEEKPAVEDTPHEEISQEADDVNQKNVTEELKPSPSTLDDQKNAPEHDSNQDTHEVQLADTEPALEEQEPLTAEIDEQCTLADKPPDEFSPEADDANQKTVQATEEQQPSLSSLDAQKSEAKLESNQDVPTSITQIAHTEQVTESDVEENLVEDKLPEELSQEADDVNQQNVADEPAPSTQENVLEEDSLEKEELPISQSEPGDNLEVVEDKVDTNHNSVVATEESKSIPSILDGQENALEAKSSQEAQESVTKLTETQEPQTVES